MHVSTNSNGTSALCKGVVIIGLVLGAHPKELNRRQISYTCTILVKNLPLYNTQYSIYFAYYLCSQGGYRIQKTLSGFPFDKT